MYLDPIWFLNKHLATATQSRQSTRWGQRTRHTRLIVWRSYSASITMPPIPPLPLTHWPFSDRQAVPRTTTRHIACFLATGANCANATSGQTCREEREISAPNTLLRSPNTRPLRAQQWLSHIDQQDTVKCMSNYFLPMNIISQLTIIWATHN